MEITNIRINTNLTATVVNAGIITKGSTCANRIYVELGGLASLDYAVTFSFKRNDGEEINDLIASGYTEDITKTYFDIRDKRITAVAGTLKLTLRFFKGEENLFTTSVNLYVEDNSITVEDSPYIEKEKQDLIIADVEELQRDNATTKAKLKEIDDQFEMTNTEVLKNFNNINSLEVRLMAINEKVATNEDSIDALSERVDSLEQEDREKESYTKSEVDDKISEFYENRIFNGNGIFIYNIQAPHTEQNPYPALIEMRDNDIRLSCPTENGRTTVYFFADVYNRILNHDETIGEMQEDIEDIKSHFGTFGSAESFTSGAIIATRRFEGNIFYYNDTSINPETSEFYGQTSINFIKGDILFTRHKAHKTITIGEIQDKLDTLEQVVKANIVEDVVASGTASEIDIPSNALPYAVLNKIGGMTYKSENICKIPSGNNIVIVENLPVGTYTFSLYSNISGGYSLKKDSLNGASITPTSYIGVGRRESKTFTITEPTNIFINGFSNSADTFTNGTSEFMLVKGTIAPTEFKPYFSGLHENKPIRVISRTKNLINLTSFKVGNESNTLLDNFAIEKGTYTLSWNTTILFSNSIQIRLNGTTIKDVEVSSGKTTFTINTNGTLKITTWNATYGAMSVTNANFMLVKGTTAPTEFVPHKESVSLDTIFTDVNYIGLGINSSIYNYIDFDKKKVIVKCKKVDLGSLNWSEYGASSSSRRIWSTNDLKNLIKIPNSTNDIPSVIIGSLKYNLQTQSATWINGDLAVRNDGILCITDTDFSTASDFKNSLSGVELVYELATPLELDFSEAFENYNSLAKLDDVNFFKIIADGTLEFITNYNEPIPYELEYQTKGKESL